MYKKWTDKITDEDIMYIINNSQTLYREDLKVTLNGSVIRMPFFDNGWFFYFSKNDDSNSFKYFWGKISDEMKDDVLKFSYLLFAIQNQIKLKDIQTIAKQYDFFQLWLQRKLNNQENRKNAELNLELNKTNSYEIFNRLTYSLSDKKFNEKLDDMLEKRLFLIKKNDINFALKLKEMFNKDSTLFFQAQVIRLNKKSFETLDSISKVWKNVNDENLCENESFVAETCSIINKSLNRLKDKKSLFYYSESVLNFIVNNPSFIGASDILSKSLEMKNPEENWKNQFVTNNFEKVMKLNEILKNHNEKLFFNNSLDSNQELNLKPFYKEVAFTLTYDYLDILTELSNRNKNVSKDWIKNNLRKLEITSMNSNDLQIKTENVQDKLIKISLITDSLNYLEEDYIKAMNNVFMELALEDSPNMDVENVRDDLERIYMTRVQNKINEKVQVNKLVLKKF